MTASSFDAALARVLAHEGGYSNHRNDPGGPTNRGITLAVYRDSVKPGATAQDLKAMRVEEAAAIYRARYWDPLRCDDLPAGVDYAVFDYGVNSGVGRAGKVLRRLLGLPDTTSIVSEAVVAAARQRRPADLVDAICNERLAFLEVLKTWPVFGVGWSRRVAEVRAAGRSMAAAGATASQPGRALAKAAAAGTALATGTLAGQQMPPANPAAVLALVGVLAVAAWLIWRWQRRRLQEV